MQHKIEPVHEAVQMAMVEQFQLLDQMRFFSQRQDGHEPSQQKVEQGSLKCFQPNLPVLRGGAGGASL